MSKKSTGYTLPGDHELKDTPEEVVDLNKLHALTNLRRLENGSLFLEQNQLLICRAPPIYFHIHSISPMRINKVI